MIQTLPELVQYLDGKFLRIDERFEAVDARFDHMETRADKVDLRLAQNDQQFKSIDARFESLESELYSFREETKVEFGRFYAGLDVLVHKMDEQFQEITFLIRKVGRHETWLHKLAAKAGIKLEY